MNEKNTFTTFREQKNTVSIFDNIEQKIVFLFSKLKTKKFLFYFQKWKQKKPLFLLSMRRNI